MIRRLLLGAFALSLALCALPAAPAHATGISQSVAVCDPLYAGRCIKPNADGSIATGAQGASGVTTISTTLGSATCTAAFTPLAGRTFNISGWGTFVATIVLERSFDGGTTKLPVTAGGYALYSFTAPFSEQASESEYAVKYYLCATAYTSGTANIRISQ